MVLKEKVVQYENGIKNIPLRRLFNLALKGGGLKGVTELAPLVTNTLRFRSNKAIVKFCTTNKTICKQVAWPILLKDRFSGFGTRADVERNATLITDLLDPRICAVDDTNVDREYFQRACKCFYHWTRGWSRRVQGHTKEVSSVMKLNDTTVVSGSYDNTLRVWYLSV